MIDLLPPSRLAQALPRSGIREIYALSEQFTGVTHLEIGEPEFATPAHIVEGTCTALRGGATRYTSNAGMLSLREAVAARVSKRAMQSVAADQIVIAPGAVAALYVATRVLLDPGDEILVPDPSWPNYIGMVRLAACEPVRYALRAEAGFAPDLTTLSELVTRKTKAILVNSPNNPTGAVLSRAQLVELSRFADRHGLYILSDEIYEDIVFDCEFTSVLQVADPERTFLVSGVSKGYAMTGFRLGYLVLPPQYWDTARAVIEAIAGCVTTSSQVAAELALLGPQGCVEQFRQAYAMRLAIVREIVGGSDRLLGNPQGAFYAMVTIGQQPGGSLGFAKSLLRSRRVAVAPGITFGPRWDDCVRICYSLQPDRLRLALRALIEGLDDSAVVGECT